ncbi:MAG TPA: MauE/DoxX family redox-associated membrane protein [Streptosporangiaceae bacterium]|nr:MauE/DoxX family redox-associated membrane protein [Streptosporangiaceae bacterium]
MLTLLGHAQIPLLAALLLGGCLTKAIKVVRTRTVAAGLGPTALFPLKLRAPVAVILCVIEFCLGIGLIVTSGRFGDYDPAGLIRLSTGLLFLVATFALIELRSVRPDVGCGCFGEFSQTPVTGRTIARSALLAIATMATMKLGPITLPRWPGPGVGLLLMLIAELLVLGLLSPEIHDVLVRIGYTAPCELRVVQPEQSLAALHRSAQWRRHSALIASQDPSDIWRELCWSYIAFPSQHAGKDAELVFAVRLEHRRPTVLSALVDTASGAVLPWPVGTPRPARIARRVIVRLRPAHHAEPVQAEAAGQQGATL